VGMSPEILEYYHIQPEFPGLLGGRSESLVAHKLDHLAHNPEGENY